MLKNSIFLYSGFLSKANGNICWHAKFPIFDNNSQQFDDGVCITNCIHDPFPYTQGGQDCVLEVVNPFIVIDENPKKMDSKEFDEAHKEMFETLTNE